MTTLYGFKLPGIKEDTQKIQIKIKKLSGIINV